jgi:hypothetical protein
MVASDCLRALPDDGRDWTCAKPANTLPLGLCQPASE